jgi:hypothetical protein
MHIRNSRFDKNILCFVVDGDIVPKRIAAQLEQSGLGFAVFGEDVPHPFVVVDARQSSSPLLSSGPPDIHALLSCFSTAGS